MVKNSMLHRQSGFVLAVSMIFLLVMTMLAVTAIRKATLGEKITGNLRMQDIAFQAAEKALRFCESNLVLTAGDTGMCQPADGATVAVIPSTLAPNAADVTANFPTAWQNMDNWKSSGLTSATTLSGPNVMENVAAQPQCMIERWEMPNSSQERQGFDPYVITARGVGSVDTAVVWLQEVIRCGNI